MNKDKMELEEAIKILKDSAEFHLQVDREPNKFDIAIKTVLGALEDNKGVIDQLVYIIEDSIPKEKIKEFVSHLRLLKRHMALNDDERAIFDICIQDTQELLEGK